MALPEGDIPTQVYGENEKDSLLEYMTVHREDWGEILKRLTVQVGEEEALKLTGEAERDIVHHEQVVRSRVSLRAAIDQAQAEAGSAAVLLRMLCGDETYDVEYAESLIAEDIQHQLEKAGRALRLALASLPTDDRGDLR